MNIRSEYLKLPLVLVFFFSFLHWNAARSPNILLVYLQHMPIPVYVVIVNLSCRVGCSSF